MSAAERLPGRGGAAGLRKTPAGEGAVTTLNRQSLALFIDTVFDAWNIFRRSLLKEVLSTVMAEHPDALEEAITIVNRDLILTPGCAVETWTQAPFIRAAREAARA